MDLVISALVVFGWPLFMVTAMLYTGHIEPPAWFSEWVEEREWRKEERRQLAAERVPADPEYTTGALVTDEGWTVDVDVLVTGERWWHWGGAEANMLIAHQSDFVTEPHWCVYEIHDLEPRMIAALPVSAVPTIQKLVGPAVRPANRWGTEAVEYDWKPVPAYVTRSLEATAAWVGRRHYGIRLWT